MKEVSTFTVILAVISKPSGTVTYRSEVIKGVKTPQAAVDAATAKHKAATVALDVVTCMVGKPTMVNHFSLQPIGIQARCWSFFDGSNCFLGADDTAFLSTVHFLGHQDLEAMLEEPCLTDALNEGVVTVSGLEALVDFYGPKASTPAGISMAFLQDCLNKPNVEYGFLNDCPTTVLTPS